MIPDTWLPTLTVVTAERVPVAVTVATTSPFVTFSLRNFGPLVFSFERRKTPPATTATTIAAPIRTFFISFSLSLPGPLRGTPRTGTGRPARTRTR